MDHDSVSGGRALINGNAYLDSQYASLRINGGSEGTDSTIRSVVKDLTIQGGNRSGVQDTVNVGRGDLHRILADVTVHANYPTALDVDDSSATSANLYLDQVSQGFNRYGRVLNIGTAASIYFDAFGGISLLTVETTTVGGSVHVQQTSCPTELVGHGPNTFAFIGHNGTMGDIINPVSIRNPPNRTTINVDNTAGPNGRNVSLTASGSTGTIHGFTTSGDITFTVNDVEAVNIFGGDGSGTGGANTYTINITSTIHYFPTALSTGSGNNTVNVQATRGTVTIASVAATTVNLGSAGTVAGLQGDVSISNNPGSRNTTVNVYDYADGSFRRPSITTSGSMEQISNLAPGTISLRSGDISTAFVYTGSGGAAVNVAAISVNTYLTSTASGASVTNAVAVGSGGSVQGIQADLTIYNSSSYTTAITLDDSTDTTPRTVFQTTNGNFGQITGLAPHPIFYWYASTSSVAIDTGHGGTTVNVLATVKPLTLVGDDTTTVNLGNVGLLDGIRGTVTIANGTGRTQVSIDDSGNTVGMGYNLTATSVTRGTVAVNSSAASVSTLTVYGGRGTNAYTITGTPASASVTLNAGTGMDTINVQATTVPLAVSANGGGGNDVVNLGNSNSVAGIGAAVTLSNPNYFQVNINDSADTANHANVVIGSSGITGLAPAALNFTSAAVNFLTINGGGGTNTYTVSTTPAHTSVTLYTGAGADTANVQTTSVPLTVTSTGATTVTLGVGGSVQSLQGAVTVYNGPTYDNLIIDDSADSGNRTVTFGAGGITGLTPAAINVFTPSRVGFLTVNGGRGNNTYTVAATPAHTSLTLNTGAGSDTINVQATSVPLTLSGSGSGGSDTVNVGLNRSLSGIAAAVTFSNAGHFRVYVDASGDMANRPNVAVGPDGLTGLSLGALNFTSAVNGLNIYGGGGTNTYTVTGTDATSDTGLSTGTGTNTVNVEATTAGRPLLVSSGLTAVSVNVSPTARNLDTIQGNLTISTGGVLVLNDSNNTAGQYYDLATVSLIRSGAAAIRFGGQLSGVTLNAAGNGTNDFLVAGVVVPTTLNLGNGRSTVDVESTADAKPLTINEGAGTDTVNVSPGAHNLNNLQGALMVNGNSGYDTLIVNDQGYAADTTYMLTATTLARSGAATITVGGQLINEITLNGGSGVDTYNVADTADAYDATTLNGGGGGNFYNIEGTTFPLTVNLGTGSDDVLVSPTAHNLNNLQGALTVNGNSGYDILVVHDQGYAADTTYTLTGTTLARPGAATITVGGQLMNVIGLNGGSGADIYSVADTADAYDDTILNSGGGGNVYNIAATTFPLALYLGTGDDTVNVSPAVQSLDAIQGSLTVNGGSGFDTLVLNDQNDAAAATYTVTATTLARTNSARVAIGGQGMNVVSLNGGRGADTYDLDSTSAATTVTAGGGGNTFHVSPYTQYLAASIAGPLTLNGGGADVLEFFDANDPNPETFSFDVAPMSLTLGSTGSDITDFFGMGGGVYVVTNGISTADDASGTVIFDPDGGPPRGQGNGPWAETTGAGNLVARDLGIRIPEVAAAVAERLGIGDVSRTTRAMAAALLSRAANHAIDPAGAIDDLFSS